MIRHRVVLFHVEVYVGIDRQPLNKQYRYGVCSIKIREQVNFATTFYSKNQIEFHEHFFFYDGRIIY